MVSSTSGSTSNCKPQCVPYLSSSARALFSRGFMFCSRTQDLFTLPNPFGLYHISPSARASICAIVDTAHFVPLHLERCRLLFVVQEQAQRTRLWPRVDEPYVNNQTPHARLELALT